MDTTTKVNLTKKAKADLSTLMGGLGLTKSMTSDLFKSYLTLAAALGAVGGGGAGLMASCVKSKNPDITSLNRQKRYYDKKIEEMENENWLNDVLTIKKKLETGKLGPEERSELEKKYVSLINR